MKHFVAALASLLLITGVACREKAGQPATETTDTAASASETSTQAMTDTSTTASTGGTVANMTPDDKQFVSEAGMGGMAEVQMGNLAVQKASSEDVRQFGQRMVTDHSKANAELSQMATAKGLALPTELGGDHKSALEHLSSLTGAEFDKAYMEHMVSDHQKDTAEFEKASQSAQDADIKAWAAKTLPTLQEHLRLAQTVQAKVR
ncbi:MAG TPA: DUF4142 domain-containing protein [Thermoanaerobaculia bacterium]|jgi:putative membrane protein